MRRHKLFAALFASLLVGAFAGPALGTPLHPKPKCNSGDGNGSELVGSVDCDPGNSGNNNGGD